MSRVLITGGTGFVGRWLNITADPHTQIFNLNRHSHILELSGFDYIIHLAPVSPAVALACAKINNARLLYCSSGIVYYPVDTQYRKDKLEGERLCQESGRDVVIARLFSFWGDGLDNDKAQTIFRQKAKVDDNIYLLNRGETIRTYMHGSEMARWMWRILYHGASGEAYDVGSETPITMLELANQIIKECHSRSKIILGNEPDAVPFYVPQGTKKTLDLFNEN